MEDTEEKLQPPLSLHPAAATTSVLPHVVVAAAGASPPQLAGLMQMIAQQQEQLRLLTRLASAPSSASASAPLPREPTPSKPFDSVYKGEGGATLDDWVAQARQMLSFYSGLRATAQAAWLATGLRGAAFAWYQNRFKAQPPASGAALFDALRQRFQPINSEETTRLELAQLKQGPKQTVDEYATRFLHLTSLLPEESVASRVFQFRFGLHRTIDEKIRSAASQPTTLQEAISLAARLEGRSAASAPGDSGCAAMEIDATTAALLAVSTRLAAMEQSFAASNSRGQPHQQQQQPRPYDSRRERGANKGSRFAPVPGLTPEIARQRLESNQCLWCGSGDHIKRDCPDRVNKKAPKLN
jgi:hypothetical protein